MVQPRHWAGVLLALYAAAALVLAWAAFAPMPACADPACARERFSLFIEIDSFRGIGPMSLELPAERGVLTPASILELGGVHLDLRHDQTELPYARRSGALDRADLLQYAQAWRTHRSPDGADAALYAMLTPALVSDAGEPLFGLMFDVEGREGFAIAPAETARAFKDHSADTVALLQLRTFTHELLHALNRRHLDASLLKDGRLTLEAPTRCISSYDAGRWSLTETPVMALSPTTIQFLQNAPERDVLPGRANTPYEQMNTSASECEDLRASPRRAPALTRWQLLRRRLLSLSAMPSASAQGEAQNESTGDDHAADAPQSLRPSVELKLQAQAAPYLLGYPIAVRLMAINTGETELPLRNRLAPSYGVVQFERRRVDEDGDWRTIQPLVLYEPASDVDAMLQPGEHTEETAAIYFDHDGWTFPESGDYEVRARLLTSDEAEATASNSVRVVVQAPSAQEDQEAMRVLLDERGTLAEDRGRLLFLGGRSDAAEELDLFAAVAREHSHTALGAALRLSLLSHRLIPPIDPYTGERPAPDLVEAGQLMLDACADSGVAALTNQLLERLEGAPLPLQPRTQSSAWAWDGVNARGEDIATYSDPALQAFGPSLHFCFDEEALSEAVSVRARRLAAELRRAKPKRVVIVGHTDHASDCKYNDALALRRAQALRRVLLQSGIPAHRVQTVSLGERRPLDFSASEDAWLLNRRVEVLVEGAAVAPEDHAPVTPTCRRRRMPLLHTGVRPTASPQTAR